MNQHDRSNLQFLLNASKKALQEWYSTSTKEDIVYAKELLDAYGRELDERQILESLDEALETLQTNFDDPYAEANAALAKFRL